MIEKVVEEVVKHLAGKHDQHTHAGDSSTSVSSTHARAKTGKIRVKELRDKDVDRLIGTEWRSRGDDTFDIASSKGVLVVTKDEEIDDHADIESYGRTAAAMYGYYLDIDYDKSEAAASLIDVDKRFSNDEEYLEELGKSSVYFDTKDLKESSVGLAKAFSKLGIDVDVFVGGGSDYLSGSAFIKPKTNPRYTLSEATNKVREYEKAFKSYRQTTDKKPGIHFPKLF